MSTRIVTFFGKLLDSRYSGRTILDVESRMGDAAEFGLAGQISVLDRQITEASYGQRWDLIRMPEHVARDIAPRRKPKR